MKDKIIGALIFLTILALGLLVAISEYSTPELEEADKIENMTFEKKENIFFRHEIIRYFSEVEVIKFESNVSRQEVGVNVDPNYMGFGKIPQTSSSKRTLILNNTKDMPYRIRFLSFGNISELVNFGKDDFLIEPGEGIEAPVNLITNINTATGTYTGEVDVLISVPKNWFSRSFQRWV